MITSIEQNNMNKDTLITILYIAAVGLLTFIIRLIPSAVRIALADYLLPLFLLLLPFIMHELKKTYSKAELPHNTRFIYNDNDIARLNDIDKLVAANLGCGLTEENTEYYSYVLQLYEDCCKYIKTKEYDRIQMFEYLKNYINPNTDGTNLNYFYAFCILEYY